MQNDDVRTLAEFFGYKHPSVKPADGRRVDTITHWCGRWVGGSAIFAGGGFKAADGVALDTPSFWRETKD